MKNKLFTIGLPLIMAVCIFTGCATTGDGGDSGEAGTLTVTGIPAEYNGKFVLSSMTTDIIASDGKPRDRGNAKGTVISNGAVTLKLYKGTAIPFVGIPGYTGNDTLNIGLKFINTARESGAISQNTDAYYTSITFESGVAEVNWDDAIVPASITITNIPAELNGREFEIWVGVTGSGLSAKAEIKLIWVRPTNGTITAKIFMVYKVDGKQVPVYVPITENGVKDIGLSIPAQGAMISVNTPTIFYRNAQINDGKIVLDFRQGARQ